MKCKYLFMVWLVLLPLQANARTLRVDDLVQMALEHSPDVAIGRFDFERARQKQLYAEGFYLPRLDLTAAGGRQRAALKSQPAQSADLLTGAISASQLLYDFGKTGGAIDASRAQTEALRANMHQIVSDKILEVKQRYYAILKAKSIIEVQKKNVELQKKQLHRAQKYLASGIKTIIDVSDAKVRLQQARLDLENAQYALESERARLEETLGFTPEGGNYTLYSKKLPLPHLSAALPRIKTPLVQLQSFALSHRNILESARHIVASAKSEVTSQEGGYAPTLTLDGRYSRQKIDNRVAGVQPEEQGSIAVNLNWNLFSGFQTDANVQEAKIGVLKASSQVDRVRLSVKRQVLEAHIALRQAKQNVVLSETIALASKEKFRQAQRRYENDLSDYIELQDAQQGYVASLSHLVSTYYDYYTALARLDHAIGR